MDKLGAVVANALKPWRLRRIRRMRDLVKILRKLKGSEWLASPPENDWNGTTPSSGAKRLGGSTIVARVKQSIPKFCFFLSDDSVQASAVGIALLPLAADIQHELHRINESLETLTRLFKFDTASVNFHPNLDQFLRRPAEASQWIGAHLTERLEHLPGGLHENIEAARQFLVTHGLVLNPHSVDAFLPNALNHVPHADFVIPILPVVFIALEEIKLLIDEKARLDQVIKHGLVRVGSIAAFGFLGKKAGIVVGLWLAGPAGAIVGALVGSFSGGFLGRTIGRKINTAAFEAADARWRAEYDEFKTFLGTLLTRIERLEVNAREEQEKVLMEALLCQRESRLRPLLEERQTLLRRFCESFPSLLRNLRKELDSAERQYMDEYGPTFLNKFFPSCIRIMAAKRIKKAFGKARGRLESTEVECSRLRENDRWEFIRQWLDHPHTESRELQAHLSKLGADLGDIKKRVDEEIDSLVPLEEFMRSESEAEFAKTLNTLYSEAHEELQPRLAKVEDSRRRMMNEGWAIGLDFGAAAES